MNGIYGLLKALFIVFVIVPLWMLMWPVLLPITIVGALAWLFKEAADKGRF